MSKTESTIKKKIKCLLRQSTYTLHVYFGEKNPILLPKIFSRISAKVYQLLAHGRWFSPGTPASSTTKTGRHDIAEIFLKVALKHQKSKSNHFCSTSDVRNESTRVLVVEEAGVPGENHRPWASNW
jgi:hypothetical protein